MSLPARAVTDDLPQLFCYLGEIWVEKSGVLLLATMKMVLQQ